MELERHLIGKGDWPEYKNLTQGNISVVQWSEDHYQHDCMLCGGALAASSFQPWYVFHDDGCPHEDFIMPQKMKDKFWNEVVETHRKAAASNKRIAENES